MNLRKEVSEIEFQRHVMANCILNIYVKTFILDKSKTYSSKK